MLFNSSDGLNWRYMSVVMDSSNYPLSEEGSNEAALAFVGEHMVAITRMDGGDGTDTLPRALAPPHMKPYRQAISTDGGLR